MQWLVIKQTNLSSFPQEPWGLRLVSQSCELNNHFQTSLEEAGQHKLFSFVSYIHWLLCFYCPQLSRVSTINILWQNCLLLIFLLKGVVRSSMRVHRKKASGRIIVLRSLLGGTQWRKDNGGRQARLPSFLREGSVSSTHSSAPDIWRPGSSPKFPTDYLCHSEQVMFSFWAQIYSSRKWAVGLYFRRSLVALNLSFLLPFFLHAF